MNVRVAESPLMAATVLHTDSALRPRMRVEVNILVKPDVYLTLDVADFGNLSVSQLQRTPGVAELTKQTFIVKNAREVCESPVLSPIFLF